MVVLFPQPHTLIFQLIELFCFCDIFDLIIILFRLFLLILTMLFFSILLSLFPSISSLIYFQADCVLCRITTKNLHDIPVSILAIVLELWLHVKSNVSLVQWILKLLQWPAILLYRMIDLPTFDCIEFM